MFKYHRYILTRPQRQHQYHVPLAPVFIGLTVCNHTTIVALVVSTVQSSGRIGIVAEEVNQVKATG